MSYNSTNRGVPTGLFIATVAGMFNMGSIVGKSDRYTQDELNGHVEHVQAQNVELHQELSGRFAQIGNLLLNDEEMSYRFDTVDKGVAEKCTGEYELKNAIAHLSGKVSCTQMVTIK